MRIVLRCEKVYAAGCRTKVYRIFMVGFEFEKRVQSI